MDVAAQALKEKGLAAGRIAVERRYLGAAYYERLRELLPEARFVDAEPVLWEMRRVKTAEEIRRIREACRLTCAVWLKVMGQAHAGMTEKDMALLFARTFAEAGMGQDRSYCIFGPAGVTLKNGSPLASDNPLREGQYIRVDTQGKYEGYLSNLSRVIAYGKVPAEMESAQGLVRDMVRRLIPAIRPGVSCAEVRALELEMYAGTGYPPVIPYTGHSLGRVVHEPPYLTEKDQSRLEPGMVVTVEPTIMYSRGGDIFISLEDTLLVTAEGCEVLTADAPLDLYH
jgi:Xaa-Pro aminopeptidase